jgi:hypothetical protein
MEKNLNDGPEDFRQINSRQISTVESSVAHHQSVVRKRRAMPVKTLHSRT